MTVKQQTNLGAAGLQDACDHASAVIVTAALLESKAGADSMTLSALATNRMKLNKSQQAPLTK